MTRILAIVTSMADALLTLMVSLGATGSVMASPALAAGIAVRAPNQATSQDSAAQGQFEALFREAQEDFNRGDYDGAARKYERALVLQPKSPEALSNLGVAYHMEGSLRPAVSTLQRALSLEPGLLPANLILGIDLVQLGEPRQAIAPLETVLQREATNRDALLALASAYFALHKYDDAADVYRRETKARADDADAWYGLGLSFEHIAEDSARRLLQGGRDSPYNLRLVGEFLTEQGLGIDAEEAFRRALPLAEKNDAKKDTHDEGTEGLHAALGFALLRLGEAERAADEFRTELRLHPGDLDGKLGLSAVALEQRDFSSGFHQLCSIHSANSEYLLAHLAFFVASLSDEAQAKAVEGIKDSIRSSECAPVAKLFSDEVTSPQSVAGSDGAFAVLPTTAPKVTRRNPRSDPKAVMAAERGHDVQCPQELEKESSATPAESLLLARCACLSGRFLVAYESSRAALDLNPRNVAATYWEAEAARNLARAAFQRAVRLNPDSWQGHVLLGDLYRQRKKWQLAVSHYQAAAQLKATSPAPFLGLATLYWENGENEKAEEALRKVLELEPNSQQANFELGDIEVRRHRFESAIPYLRKGIASSPDLLAAHADLGKAYAAVGRDEEAVAEINRALPMDRYGDLHYQLSLVYKRQGKTALAQQALTESERLRAAELQTQQRRLQRALELTKSSVRQ